MNKRLFSMLLALCMVVTMLPVTAMAEETHTTIGGSGEIISFAPLTETAKSVSLGTSMEDLELPKTVTAVVHTAVIVGENLAQDSGSPDEDAEVCDFVVATTSSAIEAEVLEPVETGEAPEHEWEENTVDIPVTWASQPDYDMDTEGEYVFSPVIEGYTVSAALPEITVTVSELLPTAVALGLVSPLAGDTYNIWVGGVQVTSDNKDNISGTGISGNISYDPTTSTLTLNEATISAVYEKTETNHRDEEEKHQYGIYADITDLKMVVTGNNTINCPNASDKFSYGIYTTGALEISGTGSLYANSGSGSVSYGIYSKGELTIKSGTITGISNAIWTSLGIYGNKINIFGGSVNANSTGGSATAMVANSYNITGGKITVTGKNGLSANVKSYPINISGGEVNATGTTYAISGVLNFEGGMVIATGEKALNGTLNLIVGIATAGTNRDGSNGGPYDANNLENYKYLKVESATITNDAQNTNTDTSYPTLQDAVDAVEDGQTIQLLKDINLTTTVTIANNNYKSFTMDLNGKILDGGSNAAITHKGTGALTIQGNGRVQNNSSGSFNGAISNQSTGSIIISGGIVQGSEVGIFNLTTGVITVSGGSISGRRGIFNNNGGSVNISGGTVQSIGDDGNAIYTNEGGNITISGDAHITSANLKTGDATISLWFSNHLRPITLKIHGGTIENTAGGNAISKRGDSSGDLIANISIPNGKSALIKGGGHAMNFAPTLVRATVTASENIIGTPVVTYNAEDITNYKYLKFEPGPDTIVTNFNLTGKLTAPATGGTPSTTITDDQYNGTIAWSDNPTIFLGSRVYTATATLTAADEYTFSGVDENAFSYDGATSVTNSIGSSQTLTVTITFPQTVEKATQVISYTDVTIDKTYGDTKFVNPLTQTTVNGTITYTSDDISVATVNPSTGEVTIVSVGDGSATITATAMETDTHAQSTASYIVTVSKRALTLRADDKNMIQGYELPNFTFTAIGLVNGDAVTTPPTISTTTNGATVGTFDITPSGGVVENASSYDISYINGTLTVLERIFTVTVTNGTGSGNYAEGAIVTITANDRSGYTFTGWSGADVTFANVAAKITAFTMPAKAVTVTANYGQNSFDDGGGSGSGGNDGGSSSDSSSPVIVTPPTPDKPNSPTQGEIKVSGRTDINGSITVNITSQIVTHTFDKALADAKKKGNEQNGIIVVLRVDTGSNTVSNVTVNLPKTVQDTIIVKKIVNTVVVVDNPDIRIGMDLATVQEINNQAKSDVNITATRRDSHKLTGDAKKAIGNRPVFDLKVNYDNGKQIQSFGRGNVSVTIPYALAVNEKASNVNAVYIDNDGNVHWLEKSVYDSVEKVLRFSTNHFSTYGVGYKEYAPSFTDIASHWAKEDIEFVVNSGLFSGTSATTFSPNTAMTRGMFVTALGRLANADVGSNKESSFSDVKDDAYYMGYIEWASKNSIINGTGNGKFAPDQSITREQMAVIMQNYAKIMGFTMPKVYGENTFTDSPKISSYAKEAVKEMQMAGVISGKNGNLFDPQGTASRAEVSAVLRRLVELVISSNTR